MKRLSTSIAALVLMVAACGDTVSEEVRDVSDTTGKVAGPGDTEQPTTSVAPGSTDIPATTSLSVTTGPGAGGDGSSGVGSDEAPPITTPGTTGEINPADEIKNPTEGGPTGSTSHIYRQGQVDQGMQPFIELAIADLAPRLGAAPEDIEVFSAVLVTWPDSSMGCPQPDMSYLQVLQDGSVIELGYGGRYYRYHSGGERTPFLCDQPLPFPSAPIGGADG